MQINNKYRGQRHPCISSCCLGQNIWYGQQRRAVHRSKKIGCPPRLRSLVRSLYEDLKTRISYEAFLSSRKRGVKQRCVLVPSLFGIIFSAAPHHVFPDADNNIMTDALFLRSRTNGRLFNCVRFRVETKTRPILVQDLLFADDVAFISNTKMDLQSLSCCSDACDPVSCH